ncbi:MAG: right-handed parallel beta-helix repeat-containing protein, partial [Thermomicrobiales bacterium]
MDQRIFDRLVVALGTGLNRRRGLAGAIGVVLGARAIDAAAGDGQRQRKAGGAKNGKVSRDRSDRQKPGTQGPCGDGSVKDNTCDRDSQCCTGICQRKHNGKAGEGRCRCVSGGRPCTEDGNCCSRGGQKFACIKGRCGSVPRTRKIPTGDPCSPGDLCADPNASCVEYNTGQPAGTYCLVRAGSACTSDEECQSETCEASACSAKSRSGAACSTTSDCLDGAATCSSYDLGPDSPSGAYCVKPVGQECSDDDECATGFCTEGVCEKCTVCTGGSCDYTTIVAATSGLSNGAVIGIAPGTYEEAVAPSASLTYRRCGSRGTVSWTQPVDSGDYSLWLDADVIVTVMDITFIPGGTHAVYLDSGTASLVRVTVKDKADHSDDSGVVGTGSECGVLTLIDTVIENNYSHWAGGAVDCNGSKVFAINTIFRGNTVDPTLDQSDGGGGAAYLESCYGLFTNCTFENNTAGFGGAFYGYESIATFDGCIISGNSAAASALDRRNGRGGAIFVDSWLA